MIARLVITHSQGSAEGPDEMRVPDRRIRRKQCALEIALLLVVFLVVMVVW